MTWIETESGHWLNSHKIKHMGCEIESFTDNYKLITIDCWFDDPDETSWYFIGLKKENVPSTAEPLIMNCFMQCLRDAQENEDGFLTHEHYKEAIEELLEDLIREEPARRWEEMRTIMMREDKVEDYYPGQDPAFEKWAFGDLLRYGRSRVVNALDRMNAWNEKHGDLFIVKTADSIPESLNKMYALYKEKVEE